ncbi:acyltransferase [Helcobacillus massiliensis]|uniref:acyltransferase family protein n=1 Tax=Helcobacillus massiliensis TaxID=521392 RepID=UPI0021A3F5F1|nr:acyltransferase family protein [Helcobacillus massiliensis]MCT1556656.1 acyltransferase [Helcobacillus massiliensis]MCT2035850.1 acyltransferase [Helcobacillus massiliensis]MCT2331068.1 acyltransferase [Helcobacillus massiliensis]
MSSSPNRPSRRGPVGRPGATAEPRGRRRAPLSDRPVFRRDIHGLRGLAVLLVVLYHVFVGRVSGGVDVFLFVSAFFLTGTFLRRWERDQPSAPLAYWARTFKRLLPPAAVVIVGSLALVWALAGPQAVMTELPHAVASLAQVENWFLIGQSVDYYAAAQQRAPMLQHFWSLSIQAQVFLLLPLLFALVTVLTRRVPAHRRTRARFSSAALVLGALFAVSLVWSIVSTGRHQEVAYFDTAARLWEFCLGCLVAIALHHRGGRGLAVFAQRPVARAAASYGAVAALVSMGALVDVAGLFPGLIALWPLSAAAVVMLAGHNELLASRPFQFLGSISYGLYLVHWPLLIVLLIQRDELRLPPLVGAAVVAVSLVLAWLLTRLVDTPFRRLRWAEQRPVRAAVVIAAVLAVGAGGVWGVHRGASGQIAEQERLAYANNPGARALEPGFTPHPQRDPSAPELPGRDGAPKDWFGLKEKCEGRFAAPKGLSSCRMRSPAEPMRGDEKVIVYIGNSRMEQMAPSVDAIAEAKGWRAIALFEPGCGFGAEKDAWGGNAKRCSEYTELAEQYVAAVKPDAVVMITTDVPIRGDERPFPGAARLAEKMAADGVEVIALRDSPRLSTEPNACSEERSADCTSPLGQGLDRARPDADLVGADHIHPVDLTPVVCPDGECAPARGNVTVFTDHYHLTSTYAASAAPEVERQLKESGFRW